MRMQTGFRGFRIDKDREEELESVRAPIPPRHLVSPLFVVERLTARVCS